MEPAFSAFWVSQQVGTVSALGVGSLCWQVALGNMSGGLGTLLGTGRWK